MRERLILFLYKYADEVGKLPDPETVQNIFYPIQLDIDYIQELVNETRGILKWA